MSEAIKVAEATSNLSDLQSGEQRTQTVPVISRQVALDADQNPVELEKTVKVFVRPLPFKRWFVATSYVSAILGNFPQMELDLNDMTSLGLFAAQLLGRSDAEVIALMTLATDRDEAFFDSIDLDEGLKIVLAVIEVNKDFFVQKVLPMVQAAVPTLTTQLEETFGQTQ